MTVGELLAVLSALPRDAPVEGAWESITEPVSAVYVTKDGMVLLDVDRGIERAYEQEHTRDGGRRVWP